MTNSSWGFLALLRERMEAEKEEEAKADKRFAAWERNHGWPKITDDGEVFSHAR